MKKRYKVKKRYVFEGEFYIDAESPADAQEKSEKDCGFTTHTGAHTTLPDVDWEFPLHPEQETVSVEAI